MDKIIENFKRKLVKKALVNRRKNNRRNRPPTYTDRRDPELNDSRVKLVRHIIVFNEFIKNDNLQKYN